MPAKKAGGTLRMHMAIAPDRGCQVLAEAKAIFRRGAVANPEKRSMEPDSRQLGPTTFVLAPAPYGGTCRGPRRNARGMWRLPPRAH
mmetsp:Transcript_63064/g.176388  ORF Transcript_63064/g.176388 Transcript_63064/m.176388 type:complete len:87 (-) Transcript_63064:406-666(-)